LNAPTLIKGVKKVIIYHKKKQKVDLFSTIVMIGIGRISDLFFN